jgi:tRNA(His) guanylyltransferase
MELGDRMKTYEDAHRIYLPPRMPVILRVDGKAFHTLTRGCKEPFDADFGVAMDKTAEALINGIQGVRVAYIQSDEISLLLVNYNTFNSQAWFDGNIQKMVSVSAAIAAVAFTKAWGKDAHFDSRVFIIPEAEVVNYFVWRQQDATRNSINMVGQSLFSHRELMHKSTSAVQEMCFQKGTNWNDVETYWKRGRIITSEGIDREIPIFSQDRTYLEKFMEIEEK